jgi:ribonuclease G
VKLELVVDSSSATVSLALLKDGKLVELHEEKGNTDFTVGDIYLGKVRKVVPSLNACFVDVGYDKDAFLHYLDLGPQFQSMARFTKDTIEKRQNSSKLQYFKALEDIPKDGKITEAVSHTQQILVQVAKEPISSKGPRLSSEITLAGRFIVLVPFSNKVSISQKIKDSKERDRLKDILSAVKPKNFGVIIRTVAKNQKVEDIEADIKNLMAKWNTLHQNLKHATPPKRVLGEVDKATSLLRDLFNKEFSAIHVDNEELCGEFTEYIASIAPGRESIVKNYKGKIPIFEEYGVHKQIKQAFGEKVPTSNGGYLIVEHTEAMHVIDVNSGGRKGAEKNQEENALAVNLEAAKEIARILQLRDMGGIICCDFIDMQKREHNKMLFDKLKEFMKGDRARHNILPPSKFGIIEITRQRTRPETNIKTNESCPTCKGTGEVQASILFAEEIESKLKYLIEQKKVKDITLLVHPYLAAYFTKGIFSIRYKWKKKYKQWVTITEMNANQLLEYSFVDKDNKVIKL